MAIYWDTSCLLKLYCPEPDSEEYLQRIEAADEPPVSSNLLASEIVFALYQKALREELKMWDADRLIQRFHGDVEKGRLILLPLGSDVHFEAVRIGKICFTRSKPIPLRTVDGLHLATASLASCREIVTADERMRDASKVLGFKLG